MKNEKWLQAIGKIDDELIYGAVNDTKAKKKKNTWVKLVASAACFALVIAAGIPLINSFTQRSDKDIVDVILLIQYDNAYYEIVENNPKFLERKGIETDISKEIAEYIGIEIVPTFVVYRDGKICGYTTGVLPEETLEERIREMLRK